MDTQKQTKIYNRLYEVGKSFNESIGIDQLYKKTLDFTTLDLNYEKCLIFENNDNNGWFKIVKSKGYISDKEQSILKVIILLLGGEVIDYLRLSGKPILHTQENPDDKVAVLLKSLFMKEAYFELYGGDINNPHGLIIVGNSLDENKQHTSLHTDTMTKLALGNFIMQSANTLNNIIFFRAWKKEKEDLELNISKRTKELEIQKETFETIYNGSKDAIAILDMQSNFLKVNPAYADMTGFSEDELLSDSCLNLTLPKDIQPSKDAMQEVLKVGYIKNFEKDCLIKDGKYLTINMSMSMLHNPDRILISVRDVTELKDKEEELKSILDTVMETVIILEDKKVMAVNQQTLDVFGYKTQQELIGKAPLSFISDDTKHIVLENLKLDSAIPYQAKGLRKDNTTFPALVQGKDIVLRNKTIRVSTLIDISELKNTEKELEIAKKKAEESTKSKSEFLANMSHEIRTPMNGILGMSHLVLQTNLNNKQKEYLKNIDNNAKNLLNIINDILDFSKIEAGKLNIEKVNFNMKELIANIQNMITMKIDKKDLEFNINYNCLSCYACFGDSLRISQILINLIGNAIKFTDEGEIKLDIQRENKNRVRFTVSDTGIGLTKKQIDKLFQSFTQADGSTTRKYGGTGLGLSISKQLVELMDGKIWIESEIGVGSKFIFEIELTKGDKNKIVKNENIDLNQINTLKGSNILLVEDNTTNQKIVLGLLEHSGINIDIANDGQEAVNMFKSNSAKYELILMDLQMPVMCGTEATKIIRKLNQDIPIIALTANAMKEDMERTKNAGMNEHLNKPIEIDKLYSTLLKYISKKVNNQKLQIQSDDIQLPDFKNIDTKIGLLHMNYNKELYLKVLTDFKDNYTDFNFDKLDEDDFKRVIHTIKGLSANIGGMKLNEISIELNDTLDKDLLPKFSSELNLVITELKDLIVDERTNNKLLVLSDEKRIELFTELKRALISKRPKQYKPILDEIEKYNLDADEEKFFNQIEKIIKKYKLNDAIELLEELGV